MKATARYLALAGLGLVTFGCQALRTGANPAGPNWKHRPSWSLQVDYTRSVLDEMRHIGEPYQRGQPELDIRGRRVFVGSSDHGLYAIKADNGRLLWRFETLGAVQCEPLYDPKENTLYFGSNDGALYKVDADTGRLKWRFMSNAEVARRPVLDGDRLFVVNSNDTVLALSRRTGETIWTQHRQPALGMEVAGYAGPLLWRGKVYAAFSDGTVTAFDAQSGTERWQPVDLSAEAEQLLGDVPQYLDVDTTPVADVTSAGAVIYVGSYAGGVFALDADTGTQVWSNPSVIGVGDLLLWTQRAHLPDDDGPAIPERKLLIASTGTTGVWALDPETGAEVWHRDLPNGGASRPVPALGALMVTTTKQGLFLLSPLDGSVIDGLHTGLGFSGPAAAYGRRGFALSNGGKLMAVHITPPLRRGN